MSLGYYTAWAPIVLMIGLFALAATPVFRAADSPPIPAGNRISTLDGLRGFLALAVFFHHAAIYHTFIQGQPWGPPPDRLFALLGPFGVSMFFMITGFLFWSQLIDRKGNPGWVKLYVGRIFRLGPLYLAAIAAVVLAALAMTGFRLQVSPLRLAFQIASWALPLGIHMGPPVNGYAGTAGLISVIWSLRYEWLFYLSLVVTGVFTRNRQTAWSAPAFGLIVSLALIQWPVSARLAGQAPFTALFCVGMLTAALRLPSLHARFNHALASVLASALLLAVLFFFGTAYLVAPICLLGAAFFLIANGASLFGLLNSRPARRLGNVSFGLYLLQLLVLAGVFAAGAARRSSLASPLGHWAVVAAAAVVLVCVSTVAHALIERPGIDLGRFVSASLSRRLGGFRNADA